MTVRQASSTLQPVSPGAPLVAHELPKAQDGDSSLDWTGDVRLSEGRAGGISAPLWQAHVRTGLLERALVLGADHWELPHGERPETGRRMLAHIDALAEAGLSPSELLAFAAEIEGDRTGALWAVALLFGCLATPGAWEPFEQWVASLDAETLPYSGIVEIAAALRAVPVPSFRERGRQWIARRDDAPPSASGDLLCAIALEAAPAEEVSEDVVARLAKSPTPLVHVALERFLVRAPPFTNRIPPPLPSWSEATSPSLCYELARARLLRGDQGPLASLRNRETEAVRALGARALDVIALAGDERDEDLAAEIARSSPTSTELLAAMGRTGLRAVFPRLLAEMSTDDFDEDAHDALVTALGPRVSEPSAAAWEKALADLPHLAEPARLRGGAPHTRASVLAEMKRPDLSAPEVMLRADEIFAVSGRALDLEYGAFGVSLEGPLSEISRIIR